MGISIITPKGSNTQILREVAGGTSEQGKLNATIMAHHHVRPAQESSYPGSNASFPAMYIAPKCQALLQLITYPQFIKSEGPLQACLVVVIFVVCNSLMRSLGCVLHARPQPSQDLPVPAEYEVVQFRTSLAQVKSHLLQHLILQIPINTALSAMLIHARPAKLPHLGRIPAQTGQIHRPLLKLLLQELDRERFRPGFESRV